MSDYRLAPPGSIRINGKLNEVYYVTWTERGRSRRVSARTDDPDAARQFLDLFNAARQQPTERRTVRMLVTEYLQEAPGEAEHAKAVIRHLGYLTPDMLTRERIRKFHKDRRKENTSDSTINRQCRVLRAALEHGRKEGWLDKVPHIDAPTPAGPRQRYLTREEAVRLYDAAVSPHVRTFIALALYTGQRKAAILELKWSDVRNGMLWFRQTTHTKRRPVALPVTAPIALALGSAMEWSDGEHIISYRGSQGGDVKKAFARTVERAGLEDVRIHDLRRTAASWMAQNGATMSQIAAVLRDRIETVEKHYAIFSPDFMGDAMNKIG